MELESVIGFNAHCTPCHEAECSGHLSFSLGPEATYDHMRNHAGPVSDTTAADWYEILAYTKRRCRTYPVRAPVPADGRWDAAALARLGNAERDGYLVPLGFLAPGCYRLRLRVAQASSARAEVWSESFELVIDQALDLSADCVELELEVIEPEAYSLRLRARGALMLDGMALEWCKASP